MKSGSLSPHVVALPQSLARPAVATLRRSVRVGHRVALSACVLTGDATECPLHVLRASDRFEMLGVNTMTHAAQVVNRQAVRDGADVIFVGEPVRVHCLSIDLNSRVPTLAAVASAQPAVGCQGAGSKCDSLHQSFDSWSSLGHCWTSLGSDRSRGHSRVARLNHRSRWEND